MKKLILSLTLILLITGCSFGDRSLANERAKRYETNWESILDTEKFATKSNYFDVHTEISQSGDIYNYEITIDNPQIAMYEVEVIVIENNAPFTTEKMMPSAGIFEGQYTMIPNQSRLEKGFVGGIFLNGEISEPTVNLKVLVIWKDFSHLETTKEYLEYNLEFKKTEEKAPAADAQTPPAEETDEAGE